MNETTNTNAIPDSGAFAKLWSDSCSRLMQTAMSYSPESTPPDLLRQIRTGFLQALSQSWDEFLRSPQFLAGMKQMMDQAVSFQKHSADVLTKARHATEGVAHEDVESLRASLIQMEHRLSEHMDALSEHSSQLAESLEKLIKASPGPVPAQHAPARPPRPASRPAATRAQAARRQAKNQ